jgi:hypothetical protein
MIPTKFQDINIRVFTRTPSKLSAIQKAFRKYLGYITRTDYPTARRLRSSE